MMNNPSGFFILLAVLARQRFGPAPTLPEALKAGVGLYGFSFPRSGNGTIPLDKFMAKPVSELKSDERNIAVLARAYHGLGIDAVWTEEGGFKK